jgi:hypothetical protein
MCDASILLAHYASCVQSGVDVGAGAGSGEGVLDVEEYDIPSAARALRASSLLARNGFS